MPQLDLPDILHLMSGLVLTDGAIFPGNWLCERVSGVGSNQTMCQAKRSKRTFAGQESHKIFNKIANLPMNTSKF